MSKGSAVFECKIHSQTLAQITWRKNNKKLSLSNKKFRVLHVGANVSYLRISDATGHTNNLNSINHINITCIVENLHGLVEQTVHLNVLPEKDRQSSAILSQFPHVRITQSKLIESDTQFKIECNVTNLYNVNQFQWFQDNRPVSTDNERYFSNFSKLTESKFIYNSKY